MTTRNKIVSYRTCLFSNKEFEKTQLVRLINKEGKLIIDKNKNMPGRGYWIRVTSEALNNPKIIQILCKRTKCSVDQDLLKELREYENK